MRMEATWGHKWGKINYTGVFEVNWWFGMKFAEAQGKKLEAGIGVSMSFLLETIKKWNLNLKKIQLRYI